MAQQPTFNDLKAWADKLVDLLRSDHKSSEIEVLKEKLIDYCHASGCSGFECDDWFIHVYSRPDRMLVFNDKSLIARLQRMAIEED